MSVDTRPLAAEYIRSPKPGYRRGNAGIGNSGAVPEPHEWALIVVALCTLAWLKRNRMLRRLNPVQK